MSSKAASAHTVPSSSNERSPDIPALFVLSIILFALFCAFEYHLEHHPRSRISHGIPPIVKTSLLTRQKGRIAAVTFSSFAVFTCVPGWIYLTTVFYQDYKGYTPLENAVHLLPSCISGMFAAVSKSLLVLDSIKSCGLFVV